LGEQTENPMFRVAGTTILLAEDNPQDAFLLKEAFLMEKVDVQIDCVSDGDQLLSRLHTLTEDAPSSYDLVLLDAHLPRRNAEEVLSLLRGAKKTVPMPVVVLTALVSDHDKTRLLQLGVSEVLSKPVDLGEYFALVRRLVSILDGTSS